MRWAQQKPFCLDAVAPSRILFPFRKHYCKVKVFVPKILTFFSKIFKLPFWISGQNRFSRCKLFLPSPNLLPVKNNKPFIDYRIVYQLLFWAVMSNLTGSLVDLTIDPTEEIGLKIDFQKRSKTLPNWIHWFGQPSCRFLANWKLFFATTVSYGILVNWKTSQTFPLSGGSLKPPPPLIFLNPVFFQTQ